MSGQTLSATSEHLRAVAVLNSNAKATVSLYWLQSDQFIHADEFNPVAAKQRDAFVECVGDSPRFLREEAAELLAELSEQVVDRRAAAGEKKPIPTEVVSDDDLALAFTDIHKDSLRYTASWNKWHERDRTSRWREDSTLAVFEKARALCRSIAAKSSSEKTRTAIASARTVASVERLCRYDRRHAARPEQWDADPFLLCTPTSVVDLHTGVARTAKPDDYLTKQTSVSPGGPCPRWREFMQWVTGGDDEYSSFLQRVAGLCATGSTREHALFFGYGTGGNGKGTWLGALSGILADYATAAPIDTFTEQRGERHPTELAMLRGARLVTSQETERGRRWAESRVKALTGGDPITARFMRQDFFTFTPEFKLVIVGNEKPAIDSVDEAIRRRFHLLPFEQHVTAERRDEMLGEKLREEWPGILEWMIEGCLAWQEIGLRPPERVIAATQAYLADQDLFAAWISEACTVGDREWDSSARLYQSWSTWAERAGEKPGSHKEFSGQIQKKGFAQRTQGHDKTRGYSGLSVRDNTVNAYNSER